MAGMAHRPFLLSQIDGTMLGDPDTFPTHERIFDENLPIPG